MIYGLFLLFYQFIYARLKGEAILIEAEPEQQSPSNVPDHLRVKNQ